MRELEHLLPMLEPPPGGLARLQRRLGTAAAVRRNRWPAFGWLAASALGLLALALLLPHLAQQRRDDALAVALRHTLAMDLSAGGIRVEHGTATAVASGQPDVRLYLVQSSPPAKTR
jgi:hypothetical protein